MSNLAKVGCYRYLTKHCGASKEKALLSVRCLASVSSHPVQATASDKGSEEITKIEIPLRKKRDEFSILRALASTVKTDFSAPQFKYIDDPYLIPTSNLEKRTYALAKASGEKAAKYVVNRYPGNFAHSTAEPCVEAFMPPMGFLCGDDTVEGLKERIEERNCIDAFKAYQKILDAGLEVPQETAEDLLDLLCFYNSENPKDELLSDELYFQREMGQDNSKKIRKEWKDEGAAETLFKQMKEPSVRARSSIIRGRAKYFQVDRAFDEFTQLQHSKAKLDVATYNAILSIAAFLKDRTEGRWQIVQELLHSMSADGIAPNLDTFQAVCYVLSRSNRARETRSYYMQTINEMRSLGIEPSLAIWSYGLQIFYSADNSQSRFLHEVIDYLKDKPLVLRQTADYEFFSTAMIKCHHILKDLDLAYRVDQLLLSNDNMSLLGDSFREGLYYTHYLRTLCLYEQIDKVMETYNRITPHRYVPTFVVMEDLMKAIDLNQGYQYLPKIWSDMVLFQYSKRIDILEPLVNMMAREKQSDELQQLFVKVVKTIQQKVEADAGNRRVMSPMTLSGKIIGDMTIVLLNSGDFKAAWATMEYFTNNRHKLNGFPSEQSLVSLTEFCIQNKDVAKTMQILLLMSDFGYPKLDDLAEKAKSTLSLSEQDKNHLEDILS